MSDAVKTLAQWITESENIVFFGGAGVSTESGIPDFRSKDGLYNRPDVAFGSYTPEYLLSHSCLVSHPDVFFEFCRQKLDTRSVMPNAAHVFLAELERTGKLKAVVTQNIDGLHQRAGSRNVFEIHGTTMRGICTECRKIYPGDYIFTVNEKVPHCACGGIVRCDVTLYEEQLPEEAAEGAIRAIAGADMLIIGGTSLTVYPAASFVRYFRGKHLAVINRDPIDIPLRQDCDIEIHDAIGKVFTEVRKYL